MKILAKIGFQLGCVAVIVALSLGLFFAKYLVPVVPIVLGIFVYMNTKYLKATVFTQTKNLNELTEGTVKLEGRAIPRVEQILSPYFKETCIGYLYTVEEYIPTDDSVRSELRSQSRECRNFVLNTNSGIININANHLDLSKLNPKTKDEHSLKYGENEIRHSEYTIKDNDEIVIIGDVKKNLFNEFEITKVDQKPFFVTTKNQVEAGKISYQMFLHVLPWLVLLYFLVNYFLFFAPLKDLPKSDAFAYITLFGLPILFIIFLALARDSQSWIGKIFRYLATVCILTSLLSFPLLILFYMIELEYYRMLCIEISIATIVALICLFNTKKLTQLNLKYNLVKKPPSRF